MLTGTITAMVRRATSSQTIGTSNTKIQWNAITSDPTNSFDAVTNFRFTVPAGGDGVYQFSGNLSYAAAGALLTSYAILYKNAGTVLTASNSASAGASFGLTFNFQITAVAGDYFEIYAQNSTSSTLLSDGTIIGGSTLNICKLGA